MNLGTSLCKFVQSIKPNNNTTNVTGASVDCRGYDDVGIIFDCGDVTGTTPTGDVVIEDSPDGSGSWVAVPGAVFPTRNDVNDVITMLGQVQVKAARPFMRAVLTVSGASVAVRCGVLFSLQNPRGGAQPTALTFSV